MRRGASGDAVRDIQTRLASLGYSIDPRELARFGPTTEQAVRAFQERRLLLADGIVGELTWSELVEAGLSLGDRTLYLRYPSFRGDDVRMLQSALNLLGFDAGREDGILGARTASAVQDFQRNVGLPPDGIVGASTSLALRRLRPSGAGPGHAAVREGEALRRLEATLKGARIALDSPRAEPEAVEGTILVRALEEELTRRGAAPFVLAADKAAASDSDLARAANLAGAEVLVRIDPSITDNSGDSGIAVFYYGREGWHSQAGLRLAELMMKAVEPEPYLRDRGSHARSLPILRETRMPAVQVELVFSNDPPARGMLTDLARAMANGIERFFAGKGPAGSAESAPPGSPSKQK